MPGAWNLFNMYELCILQSNMNKLLFINLIFQIRKIKLKILSDFP